MKIFILICFLLIITVFFFSSCQPKYEEKDGKIYYKWIHGGNMTRESELIVNADAGTFVILKESNLFCLAKDKNHVYKNASVLKFADPKTFEQIKDYYWKDKSYVYVLGGTGDDNRLIEADPKSFNWINDQWSKDNENVFYGSNQVMNANAKSFVVIDEHWGKDDHFFYHESFKIDSLDYNSAEIVSASYIKDKDNVFYENKIVKDANPKTFVGGTYNSGYDDKYQFDFDKNKGPVTEEFKKTIDKQIK